MPAGELNQLIEAARALFGRDFTAWLGAWARVVPVLVVVPAFGAAAVPAPARAGLGVALALSVAPSVAPLPAGGLPLGLELLRQMAIGAPVAIGAAILVYTAVMVGGAADDLRGARETSSIAVFEGPTSPLGTLLGLLVILSFLEFGGGARIVRALALADASGPGLSSLASRIASSVEVALAVAAPLAASAIVASVAEGLVARASVPAHVTALLAPLRGLLLLAIFALLLDRILGLLTVTGL